MYDLLPLRLVLNCWDYFYINRISRKCTIVSFTHSVPISAMAAGDKLYVLRDHRL